MALNALLSDAINKQDHQLASDLVALLPPINIEKQSFIEHTCTIDKIQLLIKTNIKINFNEYMKHAIYVKNIDVVEFLLESNIIDPNVEFFNTHLKRHHTWLHYAVYAMYLYEHIDFSIVDLLIRYNADINARTRNGKTIMVFAMGDMTDKPLDPDGEYENYGHDYANFGMRSEIVRYFVGLGLDVNTLDDYGRTALHRALTIDKLDIGFVKFLLDNVSRERRADIGAVNAGGLTPLYDFIRWKRNETGEMIYDVIKLLLDHGADPYVRARGYGNAVEMAGDYGDHVMRDILVKLLDVPVKGVRLGGV